MLKKMKLGGVLFASLLMVSGCQNEEIVSNEQQKGNYSLTVNRLVDSRTYVQDDGTVVWSKGDKMYVYGEGVSGVLTLKDGDENKTTGTFSGYVFGNPSNLKWAVFGDDVKSTTGGAQFTISSITDPNSNSPMVGEIKNGNVQMEHLCGMVRITINNLPEGAEVKLSGTNIAGTAEVKDGELNTESATFSDEIEINVAAGNQSIEVPIFVTLKEGDTPDTEGNVSRDFVLTIDNVTSEFSTPVAVGKLSQNAIKTFNCVVDENTQKVTGFAYAVGTEAALRDALLEGGNITLSNNIVLTDKWTAPVSKFVGTLNGNGYTISGITDNPDDNLSNLDYLITDRSEATIVNLTLEFIDGNSHIYSENGLYELKSDGTTTTLYVVSADFEEETFNVPEGVTNIGGYAFAYNNNIKTITLPSTTTTLNDRAFRDSKASTVILNEGLTNISYQAFRNASNIKEVVIPSTVTTISKEAFQNSGITNLTIPANVTTLEYGACRDMKELTTVTIEGENVTIPGYAFRACTKLTTVYLKVNNLTLGDGMIFTNTESNNENPNNITIYVYNDAVYNVLTSNNNIKCTIINVVSASDAEGLSSALANGGSVVLTEDIQTTATTTAPYGNSVAFVHSGGMFDGDNNTIGIDNSGDHYVVMTSGGTIQNLKINNGFRGIMIMNPTQDIILNNVISGGEVCYALNTGEGDGQYSLIATNCTFKGWTSFGTAIKDATFTDCTFGQGEYYTNVWGRLVKPYVNTLFENCEFGSKFYIDLSQLGKDGDGNILNSEAKITLRNCTINGIKLTSENYIELIVAESSCKEGQITIESKDGTYETADWINYVTIE